MKKFKMVTSWLLTVALLLSMCVTVAFAADSATLATTIPENGKLSQGSTFTLSVTVPVVTGAFDNATVDLKFDKTILEVIALNMPATIGGKDTTTTEVDEANSAGAFGVTWAGSSGITMTEPLVIKATFKVLEAASVGLKSDLITIETYEFELDGAELSLPDFNTRTVSLTITAPHTHSYTTTPNKWDGNNHWYECTDTSCPAADKGKKEVTAHSGGTATCTEKATCTACGQKYGNLAEHSFTKNVVNNNTLKSAGTCTTEAVYYYTCANCSEVSTTLTFTGEKDPTNHSGTLGTEWKTSSEKHWHEYPCCNAKADVATHTPGEAATETTPQTCTTCGYVIAPATGHIRHTLTNHPANPATCTADGNIEYWTCSGCNDKFSDADGTNKITGSVTIAALGHDHSGDWQSDNDNHWKVCAREGCSEQLDKTAHVNFDKWLPGVEGHYHECSICHKRSEVTPHEEYKWTYDNTQHWLICKECGYEQARSRGNHTFEGDSKNCSQQCGYTKSSTITIITPTQPGDSKPAEGNPSTGAVSSPVGYVMIGLAAVGALCLGAKKLTKKHED